MRVPSSLPNVDDHVIGAPPGPTRAYHASPTMSAAHPLPSRHAHTLALVNYHWHSSQCQMPTSGDTNLQHGSLAYTWLVSSNFASFQLYKPFSYLTRDRLRYTSMMTTYVPSCHREQLEHARAHERSVAIARDLRCCCGAAKEGCGTHTRPP